MNLFSPGLCRPDGLLPVTLVVAPHGYAINPSRDLGPRIMHALLPIPDKGSSDWSYAWIPVVGPIIGALLAAGLFRLIS